MRRSLGFIYNRGISNLSGALMHATLKFSIDLVSKQKELWSYKSKFTN